MGLVEVITAPLEIGAPDGLADESDMEAINRLTGKPLTPEQVFVAPLVMANKSMSSYCLHMAEDSLQRFAQDAASGTPFHIMHERLARNLGYTYAGHYDPATGEARAAMFMIRGRTIEDGGMKLATNQEIADIQGGLRRSVSVGPGGGFVWLQCDLCGQDVWDWMADEDNYCYHMPGMKYDGVYATAAVRNAELIEISGVDRGAIPGAMFGRTPTGSGQILAPPADRGIPEGVKVPDFARPRLLYKAELLFRKGNLGQTQLREWLDERGLSDFTKTISTPPATVPSTAPRPPSDPPLAVEENAMNPELIAALARHGILLPPDVGTFSSEQVASAVAESLEKAAQAKMASHPILSLANAAEVRNADAFLEMQRSAADGRLFHKVVNEELTKQCIRLYGAEKGARFAKTYEPLPLEDKREFAVTMASQADAIVGIEPGTAQATRVSAAPPLPAQAAVATTPAASDPNRPADPADPAKDPVLSRAGSTARKLAAAQSGVRLDAKGAK